MQVLLLAAVAKQLLLLCLSDHHIHHYSCVQCTFFCSDNLKGLAGLQLMDCHVLNFTLDLSF